MRYALMVLLLSVPLSAQPASFLSTDDFLKDWQVSKQFTIAVAEKMPADGYDFKATVGEMTFGEQMMHIGGSLVFRFGQISGAKPSFIETPKRITKDVVINLLNAAFDYVIQIIPKLTDDQLTQKKFKVDWPGRPEVNGRDMVMNMFVQVAHHRAQCEVYLRLKGITPPVYTF